LKAKRPPGLWRDRGDRSGSKKGTAGAARASLAYRERVRPADPASVALFSGMRSGVNSAAVKECKSCETKSGLIRSNEASKRSSRQPSHDDDHLSALSSAD
jgi:hypothetical protein